MSSRGFGLIILASSFAIAGQLADWMLLNQIAMALIVSIVVAYLWSRIAISGIELDRAVTPSRLQVEHVLEDEITVINHSRFGKLWIEFRDLSTLPVHDAGRVIGMKRRSSVAWSTRSTCVKRGSYLIGPMVARAGDPLDIFSHHHRVGKEDQIVVYPPAYKLKGFHLPAKDLQGGAAFDRRSHLMTPSISTVRDYAPGDPMNRIAWRLTARTGTLLVKEFELDPTAEIYLVADFSHRSRVVAPATLRDARNHEMPFSEQWMDTTDDYVASIAASIAQAAIESRRGVGYIGSMQPRQFLSPSRSDVHYIRILEELAVAFANGADAIADTISQEAHRFDRLRVPVVITASTDERWLRALESLTVRGMRPIAVFVDPVSFSAETETSQFRQLLRQLPFDTYSVDYRVGIMGSFASQEQLRGVQMGATPFAASSGAPLEPGV